MENERKVTRAEKQGWEKKISKHLLARVKTFVRRKYPKKDAEIVVRSSCVRTIILQPVTPAFITSSHRRGTESQVVFKVIVDDCWAGKRHEFGPKTILNKQIKLTFPFLVNFEPGSLIAFIESDTYTHEVPWEKELCVFGKNGVNLWIYYHTPNL